MPKSQIQFAILVFLLMFSSFLGSQERCAWSALLQQDLQADPRGAERLAIAEQKIQRWIQEHRGFEQRSSSYIIPIVVHVLWNTESENIAVERIQTQIDLLNRDFTATNPDLEKVPSIFRSLIAAVDIEFCLASSAPDGSLTNGITRTRTFADSLNISRVYYSDQDGHDAWNPEQYLNIWVANLAGSAVGFGSSPGQRGPEEDGIVIDHQAFGLNNHPRLNLGRTLTHEVGHYLGLRHPWGAGLFNKDCEGDDGVIDTPQQDKSYGGLCPAEATAVPVSCGSEDMYMNFMNFTNDACLYMFTTGQKLRMLASLLELRPGLLNNSSCNDIQQPGIQRGMLRIGPNPSNGFIYVSAFPEQPARIRVELYTVGGQQLYHFEQQNVISFFSHAIDGSTLGAGIYVLILRIGKQKEVRKILIY